MGYARTAVDKCRLARPRTVGAAPRIRVRFRQTVAFGGAV